MANPILDPEQFPEGNCHLGPPPDAAEGAVGSIWAYVSAGSPRVWCTSWQLQPGELEELQRNGGKLYLRVLGASHPVVALSAGNPFEVPGEMEAQAAAILAQEPPAPAPAPTLAELEAALAFAEREKPTPAEFDEWLERHTALKEAIKALKDSPYDV